MEAHTYILIVAQLIVSVGFSSGFPFLPLYVEQLGSTTGMSIELLAGLVYSVQALTMMIAQPIWGTLADPFGLKLMVVCSMYRGAIILFPMAFIRSAEQLILLRLLQGLITGTLAAANALLASVEPRRENGYAIDCCGWEVVLGRCRGRFWAVLWQMRLGIVPHSTLQLSSCCWVA